MSRRALRRLASQVRAAIDAPAPPTFDVGRSAAAREAAAALDAYAAAAARRTPAWRAEFLQALVQPALLFSTGDLRLVDANDAAGDLLGLSDGTPLTVVQALGTTALVDAVREVARTDRPVRLDVERDGRLLHATAAPFGGAVLLVLVDRTRERQVEALRRDFVVNASHELKTPVTSIQTLADALEVTVERDPARAKGLVAQLQTEAERLSQLVTDLLDLRRVEDGGPHETAPVDLVALCTRVIDEQRDAAAARDIQLALDAPERAVVVGVPADLASVVTNLVSNAVHYNREGGRVTVRLARDADTQVLAVTDTGIGIPASDTTRIFERFYRVDVARSRETGGTGLGLAIVRHAVERHGGTVTVASEPGVGSTFTVRLPVQA
ncbi:MAG: ATP-binding protein [Nitriliruptoraceae bacterium]